MRAMVLREPGQPLVLEDWPIPEPGPYQVRVRVEACGVCRTDQHVVDGELTEPVLPLIPGHEVVGVVGAVGPHVTLVRRGQRVGVPWLGHTCGSCDYCASGQENLCQEARFTGYQLNGGYAEYCLADERYAFPVPEGIPPAQAAPLLCAGLIGYRSWTMVGDAQRVGFYGFGAAAHILCQVAVHQGRQVYAFTRPGDAEAQRFARSLGAVWAGDSTEAPLEALDAAILFAPVGPLLPESLRRVRPGGTVVCAGIYMTKIPSFPYDILWGERVVRSVANLTRRDGVEFLALAPQVPVHTEVITYPLEAANQALEDLRRGAFQGAAVLIV